MSPPPELPPAPPPADGVVVVVPAVPPAPPAGAVPYYEAAALVGVEIDPHGLYREDRKRACRCVEDRPEGGSPGGEWTHCPYCGGPLHHTRLVTIPEWDARDPGRPLLAGLVVVTSAPPDAPGLERTPLGRDVIRAGARVFAGEYLARTDMGALARMVDLGDVPATRARVERALAPLGLWNPRKFGLWTVLNRVR